MKNIEKLDRVYSLYIRLRDAGDGGWTRCISCGKVFPFEQMQNGHYFSRRHIATRWDEHNCNAECSMCNCNETDHLVGYKKNLISKIGADSFASLEKRHLEIVKEPDDEEMKILIQGYKGLCKILASSKGIKISL